MNEWEIRGFPDRFVVSLSFEMLTQLIFGIELEATEFTVSRFVERGFAALASVAGSAGGGCSGGGGSGVSIAVGDRVFENDSIESSQKLRGHNQKSPP